MWKWFQIIYIYCPANNTIKGLEQCLRTNHGNILNPPPSIRNNFPRYVKKVYLSKFDIGEIKKNKKYKCAQWWNLIFIKAPYIHTRRPFWRNGFKINLFLLGGGVKKKELKRTRSYFLQMNVTFLLLDFSATVILFSREV